MSSKDPDASSAALEPWGTEGPVQAEVFTNLMGPPLLVHSTSWRRGKGGVLLTFLVVIGEDQGAHLASMRISRSDLARNSATEAATKISTNQVVEHALRHMAWLAQDDAAVKAALSPAWLATLAGYVPEPFRHLG